MRALARSINGLKLALRTDRFVRASPCVHGPTNSLLNSLPHTYGPMKIPLDGSPCMRGPPKSPLGGLPYMSGPPKSRLGGPPYMYGPQKSCLGGPPYTHNPMLNMYYAKWLRYFIMQSSETAAIMALKRIADGLIGPGGRVGVCDGPD